MQIDELRDELTTLADEIETFAGNVAALHHRERRRRVVISSVAVAIAVVVAASSVAIAHKRSDGRVQVSDAGSKEVAAADLTHFDFIVVPATPAVRQALEASPLVVHYAGVPRGIRPSTYDNLLTTSLVRDAICSLETTDGYAVQTIPIGPSDRARLVLDPAVAGVTIADVSDSLSFDLEVFLKVDATTAQVDSVRTALTSDLAVASLQYVSHADAYTIFKREFANQPSLVHGTKPSDLPASFRIDLVPGAARQQSVARFQAVPEVATVITHDLSRILTPVTSLSSHDFEHLLGVIARGSTGAEIFLSANANPRQIDAVRTALANDPVIRSSRFVDQTEAYSIFASEFADQRDLVRGTKPSDLPPSFRIDVKTGGSVEAAARRYRAFAGVVTVITARQSVPVSACAKP